MKNIKQAAKGNVGLPAIEELKLQCDLSDDCLIWDVSLTGIVITSSIERVNIAARMADANSCLSTSYLYVDGCEKTLHQNGCEVKLVTYHPILKKVVWLVKCKGVGVTESADIVYHSLVSLNQMTQKKLGKCLPTNTNTFANQYHYIGRIWGHRMRLEAVLR